MIEKLPTHYSFTGHASVYDEESLTALQLAGRQGKKINEIIEDQNNLRNETESHLSSQDSAIQKMNDETMPNEVKTEVVNQINNGTFDNAIDKYSGNLTTRLDNALGSMKEGSTTMDAEIIDGRVGIDNVIYPNLGQSTRVQIGHLKGEYALPLMNLKIDINTTDKTLKLCCINNSQMSIIQGRILRRVWQANQFTEIVVDYSNKATGIYNVVLNCDTNEIRFTSTQDYQYNRSPYNHNDLILLTFFNSNGKVTNVMYAPEKSLYIDGEVFTENMYPKYLLNVVDITFDFRRKAKVLYIKPNATGYLYFSDGTFESISEQIIIDMSTFTSPTGSTRFLVYRDGGFKFISAGKLNSYNECVIMGCYLSPTGAIVDSDNSKAIHALPCIKECTYVDHVNAVSEYTSLSVLDIVNKSTINIFNKVCCIGDSLTSGHMQNPDGETVVTNKDYAYPRFMEKLTGSKWHNCGISGANVLSWQSHGGWSQVEALGKCQLYVIGLMINDASDSERGIPVGSVSDIGTTNQTYYGGLSQIVQRIKTINPKAHIFLLNPPKNGISQYNEFMTAVRNISGKYDNTHCIELPNNLYTNSSFTNDELGGHWTATGYEQMAEILAHTFSEYINKHVTEFQDVAFIPYD